MRKPKSPCMGCTERQQSCHSLCSAYNRFRRNQDEFNKNLHKQDWFEDYIHDQVHKRDMKNKHRRKPSYGNKNSND